MTRPRHIELEGGSNFRDIGGYPAGDGRQVRWGLVYRSGALGKLTPADWRWMTQTGIASVCDLRSTEEREVAPTPWAGAAHTRHIGDAYPMDVLFGSLAEGGTSRYPQFPKILAGSYRAFFNDLAAGHTPIVVHCSAGQDRTGVAVGILLATLGVSREVILEDYHLSTQLRRVENEMDAEALNRIAERSNAGQFFATIAQERLAGKTAPKPLFDAAGKSLLLGCFATIDTTWGSVEAYLQDELGLSAQDVAGLRSRYLE